MNYKNEERKKRIIERFDKLGFEIKFTKEVDLDDPRLTPYDISKSEKRIWAIALQHFDGLRDFYYNTDYQYCIGCEDDIYVSKSFSTDITGIIEHFEELKLDILMLGYLLPFKIDNESSYHQGYFPILKRTDKYLYQEYPNDIWGSQMYLVSRSYAKQLLDKYTPEFAFKNPDIPYNPDWIITKVGKRALLNPMIAVEEGVNLSDHIGQIDFHKRCFKCNYEEDKFL